MAQVEDVTLSIPGVSCEHCVHAVYGAVRSLPGVEDIHTDLASKTVRLRYDPAQTTMEQIEAALDDAGYTVAK